MAGRIEDGAHIGAEIAHRKGPAYRGVRHVCGRAAVLRNQLIIFFLVEITQPRREDILQPPRFPPVRVDVTAGLLQADEIGKIARIVDGVLAHLVQQVHLLFGRGWCRTNILGLRSRRLRLLKSCRFGRRFLHCRQGLEAWPIALQRVPTG